MLTPTPAPVTAPAPTAGSRMKGGLGALAQWLASRTNRPAPAPVRPGPITTAPVTPAPTPTTPPAPVAPTPTTPPAPAQQQVPDSVLARIGMAAPVPNYSMPIQAPTFQLSTPSMLPAQPMVQYDPAQGMQMLREMAAMYNPGGRQ